MAISLLRIIGVISILFINFTEVYSVTATWADNVASWLWAILALSFIRELITIFVTRVENLPRVLRIVVNSATVFATGCASCIALIFPKLIYLESNHKDSISLRFNITITRNYSIDELYNYLNEISISNPIPVPIKMKIAELASSRAQVRTLYERQLELMRQTESAVQKPTDNLEFFMNWYDENAIYVQIAVAVAVTALIFGFCYYAYTYADRQNLTQSALDKASSEIKGEVFDELRRIRRELKDCMDTGAAVSDFQIERLTERLNQIEESLGIGTNGEGLPISGRIDDLSKRIEEVNQNALNFHAEAMLNNVNRFSEIDDKFSEIDDKIIEHLADYFAKDEKKFSTIDEAITKLRRVDSSLFEHLEKYNKEMRILGERSNAICVLLASALLDESVIDSYKKFAESYKSLGMDVVNAQVSKNSPHYQGPIQRLFYVAARFLPSYKKGGGE